MNNGKISSTNNDGIAQYSGDITITGGEVSGNYGISPYGSTNNCGTVTLGINDGGVPSTTSPRIYGKNLAMTPADRFTQIYFYDGKVEFSKETAEYDITPINPKPGDSSYTNPIKTPVGYDILLSDDGTTYTLGKSAYGTNGNTESGVAKVNKPELPTGMIPIKFDTNGIAKDTTVKDKDWYAYIDQGTYMTDGKTSRWANARTQDGSQWVWIPRFAYKIVSKPKSNSTEGGEIDIIFLKGTSNKYEDANGNEIDLPSEYIVHPAFRNESNTTPIFKNGGWDKEITGIWISKYEGGFAGVGNITNQTKKLSSLTYNNSTNNIYGSITPGSTKIPYPVFLPNAYSFNQIGIGDAYKLCKKLTESGNPYGLVSNTADTHLIKNSEWGAVTYLTQSKYGRNGEIIDQNRKKEVISNGYICGITGYGGTYEYNTIWGQKASTTGNFYGVYDMSGGVDEYTSGYLNASTALYLNDYKYGKILKDEANGKSTKYISVYDGYSSVGENNFKNNANKERIGEAIWETSTNESNTSAWFKSYSAFCFNSAPFLCRGQSSYNTQHASPFSYDADMGNGGNYNGFRVICIP